MPNVQHKNIEISVIIPVYNVVEYLHKCIDSIVKQNFKNYEVILIDDGSTDESGKLCDEYQQSFSQIRTYHRSNSGLSAARNFGLSVCSGKYVTFIDSDDYVTETYLSDMYSLVSQNMCDMVISSHTIITKTKREISLGDGSVGIIDKKDLFEKIFYSEMFDISAWGKLYSKELFNNVEFPNGKTFEDSATTYKLILNARKIGYIMNSNYFYIIRSGSITNVQFNVSKLDFIHYTDQMVNVVVAKYPSLKKSGVRRTTYARINTLSSLINVYRDYSDLANSLVNDVLLNYDSLIHDRRVPRREKISLFLLRYLSLSGFYFFYRIYSKLK